MRDAIVDYMARTLFVEAYARHAEECIAPEEECEVCGFYGTASMGADWVDIAPPTPDGEPMELASSLAKQIESLNGCALDALYTRACAVPGRHSRKATPEDFGFCLAMQAMGHGVGWSDNHPDPDIKFPFYFEGMYLPEWEPPTPRDRDEVDEDAADWRDR